MTASANTNPRFLEVPILGGTKKVRVRPWTMDQQDEMFPLVVSLVEQYVAWQGTPDKLSVSVLVLQFKDEIQEICRHTVRADLEEIDLKWSGLDGEDLWGIAQAIWNTSISRPGGGGMLGKLMATMGPSLLGALQKQSGANGKTSPTSSPLGPAS